MTLALDCKTERLNEGCNEANCYADWDRDTGVVVVLDHEPEHGAETVAVGDM